jgi:transcriptional regulator with XRE-family HTH domain
MLGQKLQTAIKEANIPMSEAASYMGVSETNLYRLFKKDSFEVSYLRKASELLKLPLSYFLEEGPSSVVATQTGTYNQAGNSNSQKIKVGKGAESIQEMAAALATCQRELALTQALVAAKDETITLLRGSYNRPN